MSRALLAAILALLTAVASTASAQDSRGKRVPQSGDQLELSFAPVVKTVAPAVVNIFSKKTVRERSLSPLFNDPFFRRFFGDEFGDFGVPRERVQSALGSGVIVSPDGLVVTNHHVIGEADEITVVLADRREFAAELVLDDERTDLAVLRVDPGGTPLPQVEFRDSDEVEVGDLVLAIGNPFGVGQTVTSGIVSALARTQVGISDYSFFIQTDAAINPGNSGGALVTLDGKLLGINTAIYSRSGGSIGIGFAIPSNMVRTVVAAARRGGKLVRGWTGLIAQDVTLDLAEGLGLDRPGGVIVNRIYPGGPADRAGLRQADVIVAVDGYRVEDIKALRFRIATRELDENSRLTVLHGGKRHDLAFPIEAAPETPPRDVTTLEGAHPLAGAVVANLSPALSEELDLPGRWDGVILLETERGSPAQRLGFRAGDILLSVNDYEIGDVQGLARELADRAVRWRIAFDRDGEVRRVEFNL